MTPGEGFTAQYSLTGFRTTLVDGTRYPSAKAHGQKAHLADSHGNLRPCFSLYPSREHSAREALSDHQSFDVIPLPSQEARSASMSKSLSRSKHMLSSRATLATRAESRS